MRAQMLCISRKSRFLTLCLALPFGVFGIHRFYLQCYWTGTMRLVLMATTIVIVGLEPLIFYEAPLLPVLFAIVFVNFVGWYIADIVLVLCGNIMDHKGCVVKLWLSKQRCPSCGERIPKLGKQCPHCNRPASHTALNAASGCGARSAYEALSFSLVGLAMSFGIVGIVPSIVAFKKASQAFRLLRDF